MPALSIFRLLQRIRASRLGRREPPASSAWQAIGWWEARRIPFNLIVAATGALSGAALVAIGVAGELLFGIPFGLPDPPFLLFAAVAFYAVGANVCFTGGWVAELVVRRTWPDESDRLATLTFTLGVAFAVVVTLIPPIGTAALLVLYGLARAFGIS